jgi:hypothetical protein
MVARSGGAPRRPGIQLEDLERDYAVLRRDVGARVAERCSGREPVPADDWLRYASTTLEWLDEWIERPSDTPAPGYAPDGAADAGADASDAPDVAALRRTTVADFGVAGSAVRLPDGEVVDRLTVLDRLATTTRTDRRRALFLALEPLWRAVDGDASSDSPYRRLVASGAARWRTADRRRCRRPRDRARRIRADAPIGPCGVPRRAWREPDRAVGPPLRDGRRGSDPVGRDPR